MRQQHLAGPSPLESNWKWSPERPDEDDDDDDYEEEDDDSDDDEKLSLWGTFTIFYMLSCWCHLTTRSDTFQWFSTLQRTDLLFISNQDQNCKDIKGWQIRQKKRKEVLENNLFSESFDLEFALDIRVWPQNWWKRGKGPNCGKSATSNPNSIFSSENSPPS